MPPPAENVHVFVYIPVEITLADTYLVQLYLHVADFLSLEKLTVQEVGFHHAYSYPSII